MKTRKPGIWPAFATTGWAISNQPAIAGCKACSTPARITLTGLNFYEAAAQVIAAAGELMPDDKTVRQMKKGFDSQYSIMLQLDELAEDEDICLEIDEMLNLKQTCLDDILAKLSDSDRDLINQAVATLYSYICFRNESAYQGLLNFFNGLPVAEELNDVHTRVRIVNALERRADPDTVGALVNQLRRTPSNNMTRQLYKGQGA